MKKLFALFVLTIFIFTGAAHAQRSDSIAAVVNGDVITYTNLYDRMDLVIKSSRMPNTDEFKKRLMGQVLTGLITEQIQLQEADRLNINVTDEEIEKGFAELAGQNNIEAEKFKKILEAQNVNLATLKTQIESQLAWTKVIQQQIRPRVSLTEADIQAEIDRLKAREGQQEYFIAEIYLPVDESNTDADVAKAADDLARQLSQDISKFPAAARQFSQSATAANGGVIGWVTPDQLTPSVGDRLAMLDAESVSTPIQGEEGYTILFVREKRTIDLGGDSGSAEERLRIKAAVFTLPDDTRGRKAVRNDIETFTRDVKGCLDIMEQVSKRDNATIREYEDTVSNIPSDIRAAVESSSIGDAGQTITNNDSVIVPMLCGRSGGGNNTALQREVENRIGTQRMDVLQKRYLRDLVTEAYIERRV